MRVLSFGGGVNSVAMLCEMLGDKDQPDLVIFADTGDEMAETHAVVAHAAKLCAKHGVKFEIVKRPGSDLVQWHEDNTVVPLPHRGFRACTQKFKVAPIRQALRRLGVKKATMLVGIAWDEAHRVRNSDVKWITNEFPLVEWKYTRADCERVIRDNWDGPKVVKSGCRGCPFIGPEGYLNLARTDPATFDRWERMEAANRRYPKEGILKGTTLADIRKRAATEKPLPGWERPAFSCVAEACMAEPAFTEEATKDGA